MGRGRGDTTAATQVALRPRGHGAATVAVPELASDFTASVEELFDYTCGQCHALAWSLHEETGWQLAGCGWDEQGLPEHVFVIHPDGDCVDIHGKTSKGSHPDGLPADWRRLDRSYVEALQTEWYHEMDLERAGFTARMMLGRDPWA